LIYEYIDIIFLAMYDIIKPSYKYDNTYYDYDKTIKMYFDIKQRLEQQKNKNSKLKYKNRLLNEENSKLHSILNCHKSDNIKANTDNEVEQYELV